MLLRGSATFACTTTTACTEAAACPPFLLRGYACPSGLFDPARVQDYSYSYKKCISPASLGRLRWLQAQERRMEPSNTRRNGENSNTWAPLSSHPARH
jgi:hypothetical protein